MGVILPQLVFAGSGMYWSFLSLFGIKKEKTTPVISETEDNEIGLLNQTAVLQRNALNEPKVPQYAPYCAYDPKVNYCLTTVTAYSSTVDQTDSSPFITANGKRVSDGTVACNFLPFGTKVSFPEIFGDKVFSVEDRMAEKNNHKIDIWFPSRSEALAFGVQRLKVEILN